MCKSCDSFKLHIQNGEEGKRKAAKALEEEIIQNAQYFFWKYQRYVSAEFENWEEFYLEIILRIFKEKESGRGPKENCDGYYYMLTRNICEEMVRFTNRNREMQKQLAIIDETTGDPEIIEKVKKYISTMDCKCSNLMYHYHIEETLIRDKEKLVRILKEKCGKDYTIGSIPVHLSGCLDKLSKMVSEDPQHLF